MQNDGLWMIQAEFYARYNTFAETWFCILSMPLSIFEWCTRQEYAILSPDYHGTLTAYNLALLSSARLSNWETIKVANAASSSRLLGLLPSCCPTANLLPVHLKSSLPWISASSRPCLISSLLLPGHFSDVGNRMIEIARKHQSLTERKIRD